jgi:septal ring-binding cell division protein DamX
MDPLHIQSDAGASEASKTLAALRSRLSKLILAPAAEDSASVADNLNDIAWHITEWIREAKHTLSTLQASSPASATSAAPVLPEAGEQTSETPRNQSLRQDVALIAVAKILNRQAKDLGFTIDRLIQKPIDAAALHALSQGLARAETVLSRVKTQTGLSNDKTFARSVPRATPANLWLRASEGRDQGPEGHPDLGPSSAVDTPESGGHAPGATTEGEAQAAASLAGQFDPTFAHRTPDGSPLPGSPHHSVEPHQLDDAERSWWHSEFLSLRRRLTLAWILAFAAVAILLLTQLWQTPSEQGPPSTASSSEPPPPPRLAEPRRQDDPVTALERRLAEMEVEMIRLRAELAVGAAPIPEGPTIPDTLLDTSAPADEADAAASEFARASTPPTEASATAGTPTQVEAAQDLEETSERDKALARPDAPPIAAAPAVSPTPRGPTSEQGLGPVDAPGEAPAEALAEANSGSDDRDQPPSETPPSEIVETTETPSTPSAAPIFTPFARVSWDDGAADRAFEIGDAKAAFRKVKLTEPVYVIQLTAWKDLAAITRFLRRAPIGTSQLYVESTPYVYQVLLGFFPDTTSANQALRGLPESLRQANPWVRTLEADLVLYRPRPDAFD